MEVFSRHQSRRRVSCRVVSCRAVMRLDVGARARGTPPAGDDGDPSRTTSRRRARSGGWGWAERRSEMR